MKKESTFDQNKYIENWKKDNMLRISVSYKKEFAQSFREACTKLNIKQSDVFREAMQKIIEEANK